MDSYLRAEKSVESMENKALKEGLTKESIDFKAK